LSSNSSFKDRIKKSQRAFEYLILGKEKYLTLYTHEKFSRRSKKKPSAPKISTIIINWNRLHLLKKTVESYLSTISVPYELIIVDNASTDGSKEFIESVCNKDPNHIGIILTKNIGGEAINVGLELAGGSFLHVSENDIEYITGWDEEMLSKFDAGTNFWS